MQEKEDSGLSAALTENLAWHFTAALQCRVAQTPGVALRAVTAALAGRVLRNESNPSCKSDSRGRDLNRLCWRLPPLAPLKSSESFRRSEPTV
jgi:hypothetical protein